ncbi:MAG TPA: hypothetical protein VFZ34_18505 [Blastocatellia bacterium]|nr:hypothetical protein [Blastocatellia bacterium]
MEDEIGISSDSGSKRLLFAANANQKNSQPLPNARRLHTIRSHQQSTSTQTQVFSFEKEQRHET